MKKYLLLLTLPLLMAATPPKKKPVIHVLEIGTTMGVMKVMLYNETPEHRDNFLKLVHQHFYDSLLFHRVIKDFMIQGGDPDSKNAPAGKQLGNGDVGYRVKAEFNPNLYHKKGVLAAARDENPGKESSGCQFYIVQGKKFTDEQLDRLETQMKRTFTAEQRDAYKTIGGTPHLDMGYTVYGEVIEGLDVLDKIAAVKTAPGDRPVDDVRILYMKELKPMKIKKPKKAKAAKK
jgi:cyclophilin family peptidyl-prolyl cis-trans isomerase